MKRLALLCALLGCSRGGPSLAPPSIRSFTVDNASPFAGVPVTLSWSVTGATSLVIEPVPGVVTGSSVTFVPPGPITLRLVAQNAAGSTTSLLTVAPRPRPGVSIPLFTAVPGQVKPGAPVELSWQVTGADRVLLGDGSGAPPQDVTGLSAKVVTPSTTTFYTLQASSSFPVTPNAAQARAVARIALPPTIASFTASSQSVTQGDKVTLQWSGTAASWSLSDGTNTANLGPLQTTTVQPSPKATTYTLTASAVGGATARALTVTVAPYAAQSLVYTPPVPTAGQPLSLIADACPLPCGQITLRVMANAPVAMRGVALDVPLDPSKITVGALAVNPQVISGGASALALGSGPLAGTLVLGAANQGTGSAPAPDVSVGAGMEVAHFILSLNAAGGRGNVFDGGARPPQAFIQSAAGRTAGSIAVGKLDAQ